MFDKEANKISNCFTELSLEKIIKSSLIGGQYKLEVWGTKGGDANNSSIIMSKGGLGGYSR